MPFAARCPYVFDACRTIDPPLQTPRHRPASDGWLVACHLHDPELAPDGPPEALRDGLAPAAVAR
ncbi:hypothetical protein GCM10025881_15260 [Pseudolysinimonas kribbensis]|uniref:Oligopeptide/dipeptide ABC transporter C-terminal domain-containing protein n=1 Tax=Pseudolysinimonas kribbensis TaxID=433641 RepID=A0ABQ6K419_9MICO|nr:hypothetical protein [Pseudolysinimonas kribbensis]GMA94702.1 hypothetical protein GCM10025881_15260 [Pseudolysinimonas kribbensis]